MESKHAIELDAGILREFILKVKSQIGLLFYVM